MTSGLQFMQERWVSPTEIDDLGHLNNVRFVQWIQDLAAAHWALLSKECRLANEVVWVVRKHEIDYYLPAYPNELIKQTTYVGESSGVISKRHTQMHNQAGQLVCAAVTHWCALHRSTGKPRRIDDALRACLGLVSP